MRKCIQWLCGIVTVFSAIIFSGIVYWTNYLPDSYQIEEGEKLFVDSNVTATGANGVRAVGAVKGESYPQTLRWFGIFPIKSVSVSVVEKGSVVLGGIPFGIKLYADGVMVVSLSDVDSALGNIRPAQNAGIKVGDIIVSINGQSVYTNEEVADIVKRSNGKQLHFHLRRNKLAFDVSFSAVKSLKENTYKIGAWVRDSSAGIGTVTFYDPATKSLAGLGHAVCDVDTGEIIPISSGELVPARIYGVTKSESGTPGELRGGFELGSFGPLLTNCDKGVYGFCEHFNGERLPLMLKQDVKKGKAEIYTTVNGTKPQYYDVEILELRYRDLSGTRSMVIEITDPDLLSQTGGIVQGMSGSPIIQNGKLIGAVTHVFVNDPTRGYGIFAENMLETAGQVADEKALKDAS